MSGIANQADSLISKWFCDLCQITLIMFLSSAVYSFKYMRYGQNMMLAFKWVAAIWWCQAGSINLFGYMQQEGSIHFNSH